MNERLQLTWFAAIVTAWLGVACEPLRDEQTQDMREHDDDERPDAGPSEEAGSGGSSGRSSAGSGPSSGRGGSGGSADSSASTDTVVARASAPERVPANKHGG